MSCDYSRMYSKALVILPDWIIRSGLDSIPPPSPGPGRRSGRRKTWASPSSR